ncbi:MAG TPA: preprotein translocase subunit SecG [Fimbriimonadaceae bacterium]|nr:preprotein translocase subunit SecG [Fimbriimonadaceae bacterium]HRJ33433.1 preprotein translocase subunit SecG [Fimbriimonadaceae bacterium]
MNETVYRVLLVIAIIIAIGFCLMVYFTGKGDAMSGGTSSIRTTYKGRATFDDQVSKVTLICGILFGVLMLGLDLIASKIYK